MAEVYSLFVNCNDVWEPISLELINHVALEVLKYFTPTLWVIEKLDRFDIDLLVASTLNQCTEHVPAIYLTVFIVRLRLRWIPFDVVTDEFVVLLNYNQMVAAESFSLQE